MPDTRAYFPSREEAEHFARQFDGARYNIAIVPQARPGREVFQVHIQRLEAAQSLPPAASFMSALNAASRTSENHSKGATGGELARERGRAFGKELAGKGEPGPLNRRETLRKVGTLLEEARIGKLSVVSVTPLLVRMDVAAAAASAAPRGRRCEHAAGVLEGALGALLGKSPQVREVDCVGLGNAYCTFAIEV